MKKKKPSARSKAIAKGVAAGLTPGQAYYRYRLESKLKSGRTVQEARGHAGPGSRKKTTTKQRSKVAKSLGLNIQGPIRVKKRIERSHRSTYQTVFVLSHLTHRQVYEGFYADVFPYAQNAMRRSRGKKYVTFRIVYIGSSNMVVSGRDISHQKWSTEWALVGAGGDHLIDRFEKLWTSDVKFLAIYFATTTPRDYE